MRRRAWQWWNSTIAALAVGCTGTSTGNPWEDPTENGAAGGMCDEVKTALPSLDAPSALGFSAGDVLALTQDSEEVSLEWVPNDLVTFGPESGTGMLTVRVQPREGGKPRYVDRMPKAQRGGGDEIGLGSAAPADSCPDGVELDVTVEIASRGRALDERFDAVLRATNANVARVYQQRKAAELGGNLEAVLKNDPSAKLETAVFDLKFSKLGPTGSLGLAFEQPAPSGTGANASVSRGAVAAGVARWPANVQCEDDPISGAQFGARTDQKIDGFSAQDGVDRFNAVGLQLTAAGAATKLTASFAPQAAACAVLESAQFGPNEPVPNVVVTGKLTLRSEDRRIEGQWPMQLKAAAGADGSLGSVKVAYDLHGNMLASLVRAEVFESTYGIHGLDMAGFDEAGIVVSITIADDAVVRGELIVNGVKHANCPAQAPSGGASQGMGTPGCAGAQFTQVWTATISGAL